MRFAHGSRDGMNYAPIGVSRPVVGRGEFVFAAAFLDHGHIYGQCQGLCEAGGTLKWVYDPNPERCSEFVARFPGVMVSDSYERILDDPAVRLVASAAIPSLRCPIGLKAMAAGKDYFTDKAPFISFEQLSDARAAVAASGRKYMVYFSERIHVEAAVHAGALIEAGAIGRVVQVLGLGPHRLNAASRPDWFFRRRVYGGILCDLGSHNYDQFLHYTRALDARLLHAAVGNLAHPTYPELEDFGESSFVSSTGAMHYLRVDWLTPDGLCTWGDGRTIVVGDRGYLEIRKYVDIARTDRGDHLFLVDDVGEHYIDAHGKVGFPFFGELILDCLNRTENAMRQEHAFKAAELVLNAQQHAVRLGSCVGSPEIVAPQRGGAVGAR